MTFSFKIWIFEAVFFHCCPTPPSNKKHGNHEKFGPPGKGRNSSDLTKNPSFSDSIIINLRRRSSSQLTRGFKKTQGIYNLSRWDDPMGMAFRIGLHTTRAPSGHVSHTWKETEKPSWWVVSESPTWQHDGHRVGMYKTPCNSWGYETHINSWTLDFWTITAYVAPNDILGGYGGTNLDPGATPKIHWFAVSPSQAHFLVENLR